MLEKQVRFNERERLMKQEISENTEL